MKNHLLLPHKCRLIGLITLPFAIAWLIATGLCNMPVFGFLKINTGRNKPNSFFANNSDFLFSRGFTADLNLTCAIVLTIAALFMLAFAKEKKEDEYVRMMRLKSLQISVYANYIVLALATIFLYDASFFIVMEINLFTILIIFILVYYYYLHLKPRIFKN